MTAAPQGLRFEVAFATDPDAVSPAWVDLSDRLHLPSGVSISRGRENEFDKPQTGRMTLSLENVDGALTPQQDLVSLVGAEDSGFEGGTIGTWFPSGAGMSLANDTLHVDAGTKALRQTFPTAAVGAAGGRLNVSGLIVGRDYTISARIYVPTGVPDMRISVIGKGSGTATSIKDAFVTVTYTLTATATLHSLYFSPTVSTTAGQQIWVDSVNMYEGNAASVARSPYFPNVLPQRRCRLTYRDPATLGLGNMLDDESASFEGGTVGSWVGAGGATLANDTLHVDVGSKALRVTWPTAAAGATSAFVSMPNLTIGRTYSMRARVWSATGVPDIRLGISGLIVGTATSVKDAFAEIALTFTAAANTHSLQVRTATGTTAGQQTWVDAVVLDEGAVVPTFNTTAVSTFVSERFDGHIDEWPVEWPGGGETYSRSTITATDMLGRIGGREKLRSVVVETMALDSPTVHFPLGEPSDSTTVASVAGDGSVLTLTQLGTGGELSFGQGTGVPTDGISAPTWAGASLTNGKYLTGRVPPMGAPGFVNGAGVTLEAAIASTSVLGEAAVSLSDRRGNHLRIGYNSAGEPFALYQPYDATGLPVAVHTSSGLNNGQTHTIGARVTGDGTQNQLDLWVDGVLSSSTTFTQSMATFDTLTIGGALGSSAFYAGTISHVAAWGVPLENERMTEHHEAMTTGFAGERSDQRIARACTWIGLPTTRQALDVGISTSIGHVDTTGLDPLDYMRKIETTEAGLLFAGTDGRLTFHNRARSYMALTSDRTNAISNATFEGGIAGWSATAGGSISAADYIGYSGSSCRLDTAAAGDAMQLAEYVDAAPGQVWTASIYALSNGDGSTAQVRLEYLNAARTLVLGTWSATDTLSGTQWHRVSVTATAPANTAYVRLVLMQMDGAGPQTIFADCAMLEQSATLNPFITGRRPFLPLPAYMLEPSARMAKNLQLVNNDVTGSRQGGATVRMYDDASIDAYGPLAEELDLVTTSDDDVANAVAWRFNTSSTPLARFTALDLDALTDPTYSPLILDAVDIGCRVQLYGMPVQAPASALEQAVQGYSESISDSSWSLSVNATPYSHLVALILDDPTFGALDTYPLAY